MSTGNQPAAEPLQFMSIERIASTSAFLNNTAVDKGEASAPRLPTITINGVSIKPDQVLAEAQHHPADNADSAVLLAARALVVRELLSQEGRRLGVAATPEVDNTGRMEAVEDAMIRALIEQQMKLPEASAADCERYYRNHPARFSSDTMCEVRHILLAAAANDKRNRERQKLLAASLIDYLQTKPGEFTALAKQHSDCPSREQGGNLGQLTRGSTVREFEQALETAPVGSVVATPVESRYGFHIIEVVRRVPGAVLPFELVREKIAAWLEASNWSRSVHQYVTLLAGQADIQGIDMNAADSPLVQ